MSVSKPDIVLMHWIGLGLCSITVSSTDVFFFSNKLFVHAHSLVGAVSYSSTFGFGSAEDDLRRAGVPEGRFECWEERGAEKTPTGTDSDCIKPSDR